MHHVYRDKLRWKLLSIIVSELKMIDWLILTASQPVYGYFKPMK